MRLDQVVPDVPESHCKLYEVILESPVNVDVRATQST